MQMRLIGVSGFDGESTDLGARLRRRLRLDAHRRQARPLACAGHRASGRGGRVSGGAGIVAQTIQYHGTADRYTLNGATAGLGLVVTEANSMATPALRTPRRRVGFALDLAGRQGGPLRVLLIGVAVLTVVLSWTVVNTVYTLRYADLHYRSREAGIAFGDPEKVDLVEDLKAALA